MDTKREFLRVLTSSQDQSENCEALNSCTRCAEREACQWCRGTRSTESGICQSSRDGCGTNTVAEPDCPNVGPDAIMTNISGLIIAMLGIVICLNVLNRCSNKRRRYTRKRSIFKLPVYRYPLREERLTEMPQQDGLPASITDVENGELHVEENCAATCTICLSPYQNEELVKVLPCKHEFHADCLDRWLERKANCPLCKAHAFSKDWGGSRTNTRRSHQVHLRIPPMRAVANGFARGLRLASRSRYETTSRGRQNPTADAAGVRSMSRGAERGAVQNETQEAAFENDDEELIREETKTAYVEGSAEVACAKIVDAENGIGAALSGRVVGTQGAPQPPPSGVNEGQNTGRRTPLVENQNTAEEANAMG